jgi:integrase
MIPAWYVQYKDATGRWRRVKAFKDKEASRQLGTKLERKVERQRAGLVDLHDDEQKKPLAEHVAAFAKFLANKGNTAKHVKGERLRVERLLAGCGFRRIPDISASAVTAWLAKQRADRSMSIKTSNYYLRALKAFCRWLVRDGRAAENRVAHLAMMNSNTDVRVERRTLEPDEFARLINAAESGEPIADLSGPSRVLLYLTAANSGLRASELRSLTPASIAVGDRQGVITVEAAYSKRRRRDLQPIRADLAKMLQACAKDRPADQPLWPGDWHEDAAKMIRTDLAAARRQWIEAAESDDERAKRKESCFLRPSDAAGRVFDFHALRHQYFESQLVKVALPTGVVNTFSYNADGQRVQRQDSSGLSKHIWDAQKIVEEVDQNDVIQVVYTQPVGVYGNVISQRQSGLTTYHLLDPIGSTSRLVDGSQAITDVYSYRAFGELVVATGTSANPPFAM